MRLVKPFGTDNIPVLTRRISHGAGDNIPAGQIWAINHAANVTGKGILIQPLYLINVCRLMKMMTMCVCVCLSPFLSIRPAARWQPRYGNSLHLTIFTIFVDWQLTSGIAIISFTPLSMQDEGVSVHHVHPHRAIYLFAPHSNIFLSDKGKRR